MSVERQTARASHVRARATNEGLRRYMLQVYQLMALALLVAGGVSYFMTQSPELLAPVVSFPMNLLLFGGVLGLGFFAPRLIFGGNRGLAHLCFWSYAALWGLLIAPMVYVSTGANVVRAFLITSSIFGAMSFVGYTTKRDLGPLATFFFMATIGFIVLMLLNAFFFKDSGLALLISFGVVLLFAGVTAYEVQQIKRSYVQQENELAREAKAIFGAFILFGSFVTIFVHVLSILGFLGRGE